MPESRDDVARSHMTDLLVVGASARAACFSAARGGLRPGWIDQFGDTDLRATFPGSVVAAADYPGGIGAALGDFPEVPILYTGALENHHALLDLLARTGRLAGNDAATCAAVRDPASLGRVLARHGIRYPQTRLQGAVPAEGRWLRKPLRSGGGLGIAPAAPGETLVPGTCHQRFVTGEARSAVFMAGAGGVRCVGVTAQRVGLPGLHAPAFAYCGSIGPLALSPASMGPWQHVGEVLAGEFGLRGVFGVDAVVSADGITPIEVNPRYTASVEVLELALDEALLPAHLSAFGFVTPDRASRSLLPLSGGKTVGKAVLFAPRALRFDRSAVAAVSVRGDVACADIPAHGAAVAAGAPILSVLCTATDPGAASDLLQRAAARVYEGLGRAG